MGAISSPSPAIERAARLGAGGWLAVALVAALAATLVSTAFDLLVSEPILDRAIDLEGAEAGAAAAPELFTRAEQHAGLALGRLLVAAGAALVLAGVASTLAGQGTDHRRTWIALIGACAWGVTVVPALVYPPLPPGVESSLDIGARQLLYVATIALGLAGAAASAWAWRALRGRAWPARAALAAAPAAGLLVLALLAFPDAGPAGTAASGLLRDFRLASLGGQLLFWASFGVTGALLLRARPRRQH